MYGNMMQSPVEIYGIPTPVAPKKSPESLGLGGETTRAFETATIPVAV